MRTLFVLGIALFAATACTHVGEHAAALHETADHGASKRAAIEWYITMWDTANFDEIASHVSLGFQRTTPGAGSDAGSHDELKSVVNAFHVAYPDIHIVMDEVHYAKDAAVIRWTVTGTNSGPGDTPPTGRSIEVSGLSLYSFQHDKIVREVVQWDTLGMMRQLGLVAEPAS